MVQEEGSGSSSQLPLTFCYIVLFGPGENQVHRFPALRCMEESWLVVEAKIERPEPHQHTARRLSLSPFSSEWPPPCRGRRHAKPATHFVAETQGDFRIDGDVCALCSG